VILLKVGIATHRYCELIQDLPSITIIPLSKE
jgi:hypothetical protein